jgi:hypothetical protein
MAPTGDRLCQREGSLRPTGLPLSLRSALSRPTLATVRARPRRDQPLGEAQREALARINAKDPFPRRAKAALEHGASSSTQRTEAHTARHCVLRRQNPVRLLLV